LRLSSLLGLTLLVKVKRVNMTLKPILEVRNFLRKLSRFGQPELSIATPALLTNKGFPHMYLVQ
jgi:hypothetical protein